MKPPSQEIDLSNLSHCDALWIESQPPFVTAAFVLDTNVLVSALRSKRGASHRLISVVVDERWQANLSVALVLQYEAAGKRACAKLGFPESVADDVIDMICARGRENTVRFRWRRTLRTPMMTSSSSSRSRPDASTS
ncbi:MAG: PIN domain-containing protein [Bryobacteraceae bacterium]